MGGGVFRGPPRGRRWVLGGVVAVGMLRAVGALGAGAGLGGGAMLGGCRGREAPSSSREPVAVPEERKEIDAGLLATFTPLPPRVDSLDNPLTPEKAALGRKLFFDERMSPGEQTSCDTCHALERWGTDGRKIAGGHGWEEPIRNAPSVYNAAGHFAQLWDGRVRVVEEAVAVHAVGSGPLALSSEAELVRRIESIDEYRAEFGKAFPGEEIGLTTYAKAIGAFLRGLMTPAPWDDYLRRKPGALTEAQERGFLEFMRAGCQRCHFGAYLGGSTFQPLGAEKPRPGPPPGSRGDRGRFDVTQAVQDRNVFKVPSLRNVAETAPYFHDGSVATLPEAVRLMGVHQLGLELSDEQVTAIVTFLDALTGRSVARGFEESAPSGERPPQEP